MIDINKDNFNENLNSDKLFVVDVWTTTCTSCKTYAPIFESVSNEMEGVVMAKMNGVENRDIAAEYGIRSVPTTLFLKNGQLLDKKIGPMTKDQLISEIKKYN
jgi:thioredoxin 1